jgi:hypothetical protein
MRLCRFILAFFIGVSTLLIQCDAQIQPTRSGNSINQNERVITLYGGVAFPVGAFAASSNEQNCFAMPGPALGIQFNASVAEDWKITGGISCSYHRYDESAEKNVLRDSLPKYNVHAGGYFLAEVIAGVRYDVLRISKLTLFVSVEPGMLISAFPEIREDNITPSGSGRRTISSALAVSPALDVGCGIETKNGLWFGISYVIGNSPHTRSVYEAHGTTPTAYFTKNLSHTIAAVQLHVGYPIKI